MAINKVIYGNDTLIDITDTTASAGDVLNGQVFYAANGTRTVGTGATTDVQINGTSITSNSVANIVTQGTYNASTNKIATMSDLPTKTSDLTNDSNFITGMFIASYGSSTYAEVLDAYQKNKIIYCRASSNTNPATGNQLRMAFLAYVNNQTTPTEFEFQYYRSVSTHSESQQGDQVYVYKLNSSGTWSVTTREAYTKIATSTGLSNSYSNGTMTLTSDVSDIKINNTSVVSNAVANIATEGTYNASSNKIATMSDVSSALSDYVPSAHSETSTYDGSVNWTPSGLSVNVRDYDWINGCTINAQPNSLWLSVDDSFNEKSGYIQLQQSDNNQTITLKGDAVNLYSGYTPSNNDSLVNKKYVDDAITALPEPMIFKGSLGTGGTITSLPAASSSNEGFTYKVITAGTYASQSAKVGDTFISDGTAWVLIPSGDEPSGTVTSITIKGTSPIVSSSSSAITSSGTRTISHANSGVTAGTYKSVTVNATGHVTAGSNPTTISGYGITDAKIANGVITLGSNTITPLTSSSSLDASKLTGTVPSGCYTNNDIQINGTSIVSSNVANIVTNTAYNSSTNKIATMSDVPDIKVNNSSIVSNGVADLKTNSAYNASSNKIATMSDIPNVSGKLDTSKVKTTTSTTSGDVYDVTYINSMLGDIESLLGGI